MNELDRKKMTVYERTLGHFIDKLREFYSDLDAEIFSVKTIANNTGTAVTNLHDAVLELKTKIDLLIRESSSQNAQLEKFRVEIRNSLERNFTEQRERMKKAIRGAPDKEPLKFAKAKEITGGPTFSEPLDRRLNDQHAYTSRRTDEGRKLSFFGIGKLKVEL